MPTLRDLQSAFRAAMLGGDAAAVEAAVQPDGLDVAARLTIYRHHVFTSLTTVLETTFPVVVRLVDPRFFRYATDRFVREHPPTGPCLSEYGAALPDFLARFEPSRPLAYLPDVARLEWAMNVALHAPDATCLPPEALREPTALALHPSVTLLQSPWPIDTIWHANQPDAGDDTIDLDAGGVHLQVWRSPDEVVFRRLSAASFGFHRALADTGRLDAGAHAAVSITPGTDLPSLIRDLLADQILVRRTTP